MKEPDFTAPGKIVALAGGIGGAKLVEGLQAVLGGEQLSVIANTGDDILLHGLRICPDVDTLLYTLSGEVNRSTGWGIDQDSFHCLHQLRRYEAGSPWFNLGDRDLALHLYRTSGLQRGDRLSELTADVACKLGVEPEVIPMAEGYHPTWIDTDRGRLHLQEYLIREKCLPQVQRIHYQDIERAEAPEAAVEALSTARAIIFCPSNPFISIGPILSVPAIAGAIASRRVPLVVVSPIVSGRAIKGPAGKMMKELGYEVSARGVAGYYRETADWFILDDQDAELASSIEDLGLRVEVIDTMMTNSEKKVRLARHLMEIL